MKIAFAIALMAAALALSGCVQPVPDFPPAGTGIGNCGSIDIMRLATERYLAKGEIDALACFNEKMADCNEASFGLTGQFGGLFSVVGEQESDCLISYYDNTDKTLKTCVFPKEFLSTAAATVEELGQPKLLIMTVTVGMQGTSFTNQFTGETMTIECS